MAAPILTVNELGISFGDAAVVRDVSFQLGAGETLAIVGESGSGKSVSALSLMGLLPESAVQTGQVLLQARGVAFDSQTAKSHWNKLRGNLIGMIFQEPMSSLNPVMQIGKQIAESIMLHQKLSKEAAQKLTIDWLRNVHLPEPDKIYSRYPHQLSGGQKQRVMIAIAMCNNPALLIADEPTTALDVTVQQEVLDLMEELQRKHGTAMIFITHDLALAAKISDRVLVMHKGNAVEYGAVSDVLNNPQEAYTKALLACRPSPEHKGRRLAVVADFMSDEDVSSKAKVYKDTITENSLLQVDGLKVWFETGTDWLGKTTGYFKAVDGVSFDLKKGEVLGLVGESGCGKSTISKSLMGILPVQDGAVQFKGKDLAKINSKEWREVRKDIQLIFQDPYASLNPRMTVGEMLTEPLAIHNIVPKRERRREAKRLLDLVQLPADSMKRYPHQFSGGQRQRIGIARALAVRPELIICDESVSALDVSVQAQILNLLKDLQAAFELTYLFISHDLNVVHYISDRVLVMQTGKIVEAGNATQVLKAPAHEYTQKLVEAMP